MVIYVFFLKQLFNTFRGNRSTIDGDETSRESQTSPSFSERRIAGHFDHDETEAANMLGTQYINNI